MASKAKKNFYEKAYDLLARPVLWLFRVRVEGTENLPEDGGYLYCSNHICLLDPILISAAAKTQVHYMAKKELFKIPLLSGLIKILGAYPVDRGGSDVGAIRRSIALLTEKKSIGLFIQGHRYSGVPLRETKPKNGAAMIAHRAGVPVVPVCIKMKNNRFVPFRRITIAVGRPLYPADLISEEQTQGAFSGAAQKIFEQICVLGDEANG